MTSSFDEPLVGVSLSVSKMQHIPSFKNKKRAIKDSKTGAMRTLTEPDAKAWMQKCIDSFVYQLNCMYRTREIETLTERCPLCWIAAGMPSDDSVNHIREIHVYVKTVTPGNEGAIITFTPCKP